VEISSRGERKRELRVIKKYLSTTILGKSRRRTVHSKGMARLKRLKEKKGDRGRVLFHTEEENGEKRGIVSEGTRDLKRG